MNKSDEISPLMVIFASFIIKKDSEVAFHLMEKE